MSFHGNTLGSFFLAYHPIRRAPYADILDDVHFHHVSPAYAKRFQRADENEEQYVERLRQELEDKFLLSATNMALYSFLTEYAPYLYSIFILTVWIQGDVWHGTYVIP